MMKKQKTPKIQNAKMLIATLFSDGGSVKKDLVSDEVLQRAQEVVAESGLTLVETDKDISLRTAPECAEAILESRKEELEKNIGPAGLEIIAIVLYGETPTRATIDYIRGVNSSASLRTLLMRGLLTREKEKGAAGFVYKPTAELLAHLGVTCASALPAYDEIRTSLHTFIHAEEQEALKET